MNVELIAGNIEKLTAAYAGRLDEYVSDGFTIKPDEETWSAGEIYHHVFDSSILSLQQITMLLNGNGTAGEPTLAGKAILFSGMFPPGLRFRAPGVLVARLKNAGAEEVKQMIADFRSALDITVPLMENKVQVLASKHPRLGYFNAVQWLRFTEIHLQHHLKQLDRLKKKYK